MEQNYETQTLRCFGADQLETFMNNIKEFNELIGDMNVIKRKDAKALGFTKYFTGKPCQNGHIAEKKVNGGCIMCNANRGKKWRQEHPDSIKKYREDHNDEILIWRKQYCKDNSAKKVATCVKYNTSKLRRIPNWISLEELEQIKIVYQIAANMSKLDGIQYDVDHIIPLQGNKVSGFHTLSNLQIITHIANCTKGNRYQIL